MKPASRTNTKCGVVVIGRNEGARLQRCLLSLSTNWPVVYVDSGSVDGSAQWARDRHFEVVDLDPRTPFTAARARNAGFGRLCELAPDLPYVQFLDGDCELAKQWLGQAISFLDSHPEAAAVAGQLRERSPERSVYNWLCDREWDGPTGEVRLCGGIVMMRVSAFASVHGFRSDLIAGEEPELCVRLRSAGWHIWRLRYGMAWHDASMVRFRQWWKRSIRSGYVFAQGAYLHGAPPEYHFVWESRRAWVWGLWLPIACVLMGFVFPPWGWAACIIYVLQVGRLMARNGGSLKTRAVLALFHMLGRFPEFWGELRFLRDRMSGRQARLIEYK